MLCKVAAAGLEDRLGFAPASELVLDALAIAFLEFGFVIEQIDLGGPPEHKEKDHRFGFRRKFGLLSLEHRGKGQGAKACAGLGAEVPTVEPRIRPVVFGEHQGLIHIEEFVAIENRSAEACQSLRVVLQIGAGPMEFLFARGALVSKLPE